MNLREYQEWTKETAIYPKAAGVEYCAIGLSSEVGEVSGKIKKWIRDRQPLTGVKAELGDVLWYVARLSDECGFDLQEILEENVSKLNGRRERGVLVGNGDNR